MIRSSMYLTSSRPDIMFDVCYCAMFHLNPCEPHTVAVKNKFQYFKRTTSLRIWYPSNIGFVLILVDVDLIVKALLGVVSNLMENL